MTRPFNLDALDHVVLRTGQLNAMIAFYCDVLGCKVERRLADDLGLVQLRAGAALIDLVTLNGELGRRAASQSSPPSGTAAGTARRDDPNMDHFCLTVDRLDEDALLAYLRAHDVAPSPVGERYGARGFGPSIYINDPDGNTVELKGPPT